MSLMALLWRIFRRLFRACRAAAIFLLAIVATGMLIGWLVCSYARLPTDKPHQHWQPGIPYLCESLSYSPYPKRTFAMATIVSRLAHRWSLDVHIDGPFKGNPDTLRVSGEFAVDRQGETSRMEWGRHGFNFFLDDDRRQSFTAICGYGFDSEVERQIALGWYTHSEANRVLNMKRIWVEAAAPLWFIVLITGAWPALAFIRGPLRRRRWRNRGFCVGCGYDLTGNETGVCSECGKAIADQPTA